LLSGARSLSLARSLARSCSLARLFSLFLLSVSLSRRLPPLPTFKLVSLSLSLASVSDLTDWKRKGAVQIVSKCGDAIGCRVKMRCNPRLASLSTTYVHLDVIGRIPVLLDPHKHRNNAAVHQGSLYAHQTQSCATVLRDSLARQKRGANKGKRRKIEPTWRDMDALGAAESEKPKRSGAESCLEH
jgi:hypothetical protein